MTTMMMTTMMMMMMMMMMMVMAPQTIVSQRHQTPRLHMPAIIDLFAASAALRWGHVSAG
eukprot:346973-Pyramimonas_sp.AAC.1